MRLTGRRFIKLLTCLSSASAFGYLFLFFFTPVERGDSWIHLSLGRFIVENRQFPQVDVFSFFRSNVPWIFPQWLGSCLFFVVDQFGGIWILKLLKSFIFILSFGIFFRSARNKVPFVFILLLVLPMALGLDLRNLFRPLIFNFIFIQVFLSALFAYYQSGKGRCFIWLPLLGILWQNIHLGAFVYGGIILFSFWAGAFSRYLRCRFHNELNEDRCRSTAVFRGLTVAFCLFFLVSFVNPYGFRAAFYPVKMFLGPYLRFLAPSYVDLSKVNDFVAEMLPPAHLFSASFVWFWILASVGLLASVKNKKNRFIALLLFCLACFLFLYTARASGFFVFVCGYLVIDWAQSVHLKSRWMGRPAARQIEPVLLVLAFFIFSGLLLRQFNIKIHQNGRTLRRFAVDIAPENPSASIEFLRREGVSGNVFNADPLGGYLIWTSFPRLKPFIDGRWADSEAFNEFSLVLEDPDRYWPQISEKRSLNVVVLDTTIPSFARLHGYLKNSRAWQIVFVEGTTVIYLKRGVYSLSAQAENFENGLKSFRSSVLLRETRACLKLSPAGRIRDYFDPPAQYIDLLEEGITLFDMGYRVAGLERVIRARRVSDQTMTCEVEKLCWRVVH